MDQDEDEDFETNQSALSHLVKTKEWRFQIQILRLLLTKGYDRFFLCVSFLFIIFVCAYVILGPQIVD